MNLMSKFKNGVSSIFKSRTATLLLFLIVGSAFFYNCSPYGLSINTSASVPLGLYMYKDVIDDTISIGDIICFPYTSKKGTWYEKRKYFPENKLICKEVFGVPGDSYEKRTKDLYISKIFAGRIADKDSKQREIGSELPQSGTLKEDEFLVISKVSPIAFDSRYIGIIHKSDIKKKIYPIFTRR